MEYIWILMLAIVLLLLINFVLFVCAKRKHIASYSRKFFSNFVYSKGAHSAEVCFVHQHVIVERYDYKNRNYNVQYF